MQVTNLGDNCIELRSKDVIILISYQIPIAAYCGKNEKFYRTTGKCSVAVENFIDFWLSSNEGIKKPQWFFDDLLMNL